MNPLNVLTAYHVMRDARDLEPAGDGWVFLDRRRTTRLQLDADRQVTAASRDGREVEWVMFSDSEHASPNRRRHRLLRHAGHPAAGGDAGDADQRRTGGAVRRAGAPGRRRSACATFCGAILRAKPEAEAA